MATRSERRLAAILAADVAGYSRHVDRDEEGTVDALKERLIEFDEIVRCEGGAIVNTAGDGVLAEFPSAVRAAEAAISIQRRMAAQNAGLPEPQRLRFRIGINVGDVIAHGRDMLGDDVNVAARLQQLADPGEVLLSGSAFDQLQGKLSLPLDFVGEQRVKNIARPIRTYQVRSGNGRRLWRLRTRSHRRTFARAAAAVAVLATCAAIAWWLRTAEPVTDEPTIAVLPFDSYGGDAVTGRLAEGITADIITDLARFREFGVIARNSVEAYRGKAVDIGNLGRALHVRFVLEGSIQRQDDQVRVAAQLIDARNEVHVWSERWDRPARDLFDVQADLSRQVAGKLSGIAGVVVDADRMAARRKAPTDLGAYDLYVLATEGKQQETRESIERAITLLNKSLAIDPNFARAWALLGSCYAIMLRWTADWDATYGLYVKHFRHAVDLDPMDADAHAGLAYALGLGGDLRGAEAQFEMALELNPNSADVLTRYGSFAAGFGHPADGAAMADLAGRLDPNPPPWAARFRSYALFGGGRFDEAIRVRERVPKAMFAEADYIELAIFLAAAGRTEEAVALAQESKDPFPHISIEGWTGTPDYNHKERKELVGYMRLAGFPPCADPTEVSKGRIQFRLPECAKR